MKTYKKCLKSLKALLLIMSMVVIFSFGFHMVNAADTSHIYVSPSGNDTWNGQASTHLSSNVGPKKTIKNAVNIVSSGGLVNIASGTYYETDIVIQKNMTIKGTDKTKTIINANHNGKIFTIDTNIKATIANIKLINGRYINGGAIENAGSLTVDNSSFTSNAASNFGGAILNYYGFLSVSNTYFIANRASKQGGAIYNTHGTLKVTNSNFLCNRDDIGGAICNYYGKSDLKYICFENNSAASYGGSLANTGTLNAYRCTFKTNKANNSGGAIINYQNSILSMTNSIFTGNTAAKYGGAIYNLGKATLTNVYYSYNTGFEGACIFSSKNLDVNTNTFKNNRAYSVAGAVDNYHGISNLNNSTFLNNYANIFGGAVYNDNQYSSDKCNSIVNIQGCNFTNNKANISGGAIHNNHGTLNVSKSKLANNLATQYGGAITNYCGISRLTYSSLSSNRAGTYGGAIYNVGSITMITNRFLYNSANIGGGAILNNQGTIAVSNSNFTCNLAKTHGGAIYNIRGITKLSNNTFINNTSYPNSGGAIYNYYGNLVTIYNNIIGSGKYSIYNVR